MRRYNYFSSKIFSSEVTKNKKWTDKVNNSIGDNEIFTLYRIEEKLYAAALCYSKLKHRSKNFNKIQKIENYFGGTIIRTNHAYEYFFFACCRYIYQELINASLKNKTQRLGQLVDKLKVLSDERRVQEHGKDWSWGKIPKKYPPVPSKGDNYNFKQNIDLLENIYIELIKII